MLYSKGAVQDDSDCAYRLAVLYEEGRGVAPNPKKAKHWLTKAAEVQYQHWYQRWYRHQILDSSTSIAQLHCSTAPFHNFGTTLS